ncbi:Sec-independent protein translocase protein TatA/B/E [Acididesulfobacillus acetoxydans]|uniref:MttA/Hcf106 family n=1 Tax=Acididesulfobacillus acetoxydans TaxID=1561005 RepID=A0A8S0Y377_9FIRM|nr:twin-arginine translocase TatA/TatE family subunit [Acididesulfobacillus acetoxydans]CAA7601745.1 Sec-independent protein translocase protein TatA/B/E [Acididesulfobacillus acetoxydans]CEJ09036.1 mttA/Hcf106 family [Acididesulfobacillus acetoxydans]
MGFSEIVLLMAIALILFGPEDLPEIARTLGRVVYEIRKATGELTGGFSDIVRNPTDALNKAFEEKERGQRGPDGSDSGTKSSETGENAAESEEELLDYEGKPVQAEGAPKPAAGEGEEAGEKQSDDPLAKLPAGVVSYEEKEKDASR